MSLYVCVPLNPHHFKLSTKVAAQFQHRGSRFSHRLRPSPVSVFVPRSLDVPKTGSSGVPMNGKWLCDGYLMVI